MEAVISGQSGAALVIDGEMLTSIHIGALNESIVRRATDFRYLFGSASDVCFVEDLSLEEIQQHLQNACDSERMVQVTLTLLEKSQSPDVSESAARELDELLTTNQSSQAVAERLLLSVPLPESADTSGAIAMASDNVSVFVNRLDKLQQAVRNTYEAWQGVLIEITSGLDESAGDVIDALEEASRESLYSPAFLDTE